MKKILVVILTVVLGASLFACGSSESSSDKKDEATTNEEAEAANDDSEDSDVEAAEEEKDEKTEASFEEIVLVDNEQCTMKIVGVDPDDIFGFALKVFLENKTEDVMMFSVEDCSVNGYMVDPFWASEVAAGKKSNEDITWYSDSLKENGIEEVENIEMKVRIYNSDDWELEPYVEEVFTIDNLK